MTGRECYVGGLDCYVIEMKFKGYGDDAPSHAPVFFRTFRGKDVHDGTIVTSGIIEAHRFPSEKSAAGTARLLLHNPSVRNDTRNSYDIFIRKLECGIAKSVQLSNNGAAVVSD